MHGPGDVMLSGVVGLRLGLGAIAIAQRLDHVVLALGTLELPPHHRMDVAWQILLERLAIAATAASSPRSHSLNRVSSLAPPNRRRICAQSCDVVAAKSGKVRG